MDKSDRTLLYILVISIMTILVKSQIDISPVIVVFNSMFVIFAYIGIYFSYFMLDNIDMYFLESQQFRYIKMFLLVILLLIATWGISFLMIYDMYWLFVYHLFESVIYISIFLEIVNYGGGNSGNRPRNP